MGLQVRAGMTAILDDVTVSDTEANETGNGVGIAVFEGAVVDATDLHISNTANVGFYAEGATVTLRGLTVHDLSPTGSRASAFGMVINGGTISLDDALIGDIIGVGLFVDQRATLDAHGLEVHDISSGDGSARGSCRRGHRRAEWRRAQPGRRTGDRQPVRWCQSRHGRTTGMTVFSYRERTRPSSASRYATRAQTGRHGRVGAWRSRPEESCTSPDFDLVPLEIDGQ